MMICPETFYEMHLKGKNKEEIMTVIRGLKREIGRLKRTMEHPSYAEAIKIHPSEDVRISCSREYLERAIEALEEVGGTYTPSAAEKRAMDFDSNLPYLTKVEFCIGAFFGGYRMITYTIDGDTVHTEMDPPFPPCPIFEEDEALNKERLLSSLEEMHIGEWHKRYDCKRFGRYVLDGTGWHLYLYFSNGHRPVKISGYCDYPYNFDRLLDLFNLDPSYQN